MFTDISIISIYELDYLVEGQKNRELAQAMSYGCKYTEKGEKDFSHIVSGSDQVVFYPEDFLEEYANETFTSNYFIEMDCNPANKSSRVIQVGNEPPETGEVIVRSIPVPQPRENLTQIKLYRWY